MLPARLHTDLVSHLHPPQKIHCILLFDYLVRNRPEFTGIPYNIPALLLIDRLPETLLIVFLHRIVRIAFRHCRLLDKGFHLALSPALIHQLTHLRRDTALLRRALHIHCAQSPRALHIHAAAKPQNNIVAQGNTLFGLPVFPVELCQLISPILHKIFCF